MARAIQSIASSYSDYVEKSAKKFNEVKYGEWSKYLEDTPIFLDAYFSVSDISTRCEVGTGNVNEEIGKQSPVRYNKIKNLPAYNLRDLKPSIEFDSEEGYDIEVENSDLTFLPNTIKPKPGDYFVVKLQGVKTLIFRINSANFNSIQSNDFYLSDYELKGIGEEAEKKYAQLDKQTVETYVCIYENIGTEDKAIIKDSDFEKVKELSKFITQLKELYLSLYYNKNLDAFLFKGEYKYTTQKEKATKPSNNNRYIPYGFKYCRLHRDSFFSGCPVADCESCPHFSDCDKENLPKPPIIPKDKCDDPLCPIHGPFVSKLKEAQKLLQDNIQEVPPELNTVIVPECHFYDMYLIRFLQESRMFDDDNSDTCFSLVIDDVIPNNFELMYRRSIWYALLEKDLDYFNQYVIVIPKKNKKITSMFNVYRVQSQCVSLEAVDPKLYHADRDIELVGFKHYFPKLFINAIIEKNEEDISRLTYCERLVYDYFNNSLPNEIDTKSILIELMEQSELNLKYGAIVLFILTKVYDNYFQ